MSDPKNVCFHTVLGSRIQKEDLGVYTTTGLEKACRGAAIIIDTGLHLYVGTWTRSILCSNGVLQNDAPLVVYPEKIETARTTLLEILEPRGLWYAGQFGVWSFAETE